MEITIGVILSIIGILISIYYFKIINTIPIFRPPIYQQLGKAIIIIGIIFILSGIFLIFIY